MFRAVIETEGALAENAVRSVSPESGRELPRTRISVNYDGNTAVITAEASDASAMRAALNSLTECIAVVQNVQKIAE